MAEHEQALRVSRWSDEPVVFVIDEDPNATNAVRRLTDLMQLRCQAFASGRNFLKTFNRSQWGCVVTELTVADLGGIATRFAPGDSLILRTGWSAFVDETKWRDELPRVSLELANWCVEHHVKLLGVEPPSVADVNHLPELIQIHQTLLRGGVLIVEGLINLDAIVQEKVFFAALPLKPLRGDGSPVRAFAIEGGQLTAL